LDGRLGGPQSRSGCSGEEKNSQLPPGIESPNQDRYLCEIILLSRGPPPPTTIGTL